MLRTLIFGSCYVYSPSGEGKSSVLSRQLCSLIKTGDVRFTARYAARIRREAGENSTLHNFFCSSDILVPVPRSEAHISDAGAVTHQLAAALLEEGLGRALWSGLARIHAVRKSATAPPGRRPTVREHYDSFAIESAEYLPGSGQFMLIDDVVTKGRTLLAAATRIQEAFPASRVRAFALLRTLGMAPNVTRLLDPCVGRIGWRGGDAHRAP